MDDVVVFEASNKKALIILVSAVALTVVGVVIAISGAWFGWLLVAFFGLGIPLALAMLRPGSTYLRLDREGFEMKTVLKATRTKWSDVNGFALRELYGNPMIAIEYSPAYRGQAAGRKVARAMSGGMEAAIPDHYKAPPSEVLAALERFLQRYGSGARA